jgi:hypothetical protein
VGRRFTQYLQALWHHILVIIGSAIFALPTAVEFFFPSSHTFIDPMVECNHPVETQPPCSDK